MKVPLGLFRYASSGIGLVQQQNKHLIVPECERNNGIPNESLPERCRMVAIESNCAPAKSPSIHQIRYKMNSPDIRHLKICEQKGIPIKEDSYILDFGCGDSHRVYQLHDFGYKNSFGYNKADYMGVENPVNLKRSEDIQFFRFSVDGIIPFPDNYFDLIVSDQVFEHVVEQEAAFVKSVGC